MKQARTLLEYLDRRLGAHVGNGPDYSFHCPACLDRTGSESNKRKFGVNLDRRVGHCFRCGYKFGGMPALFRCINGASGLTMEERILLREDPPIVHTSVKRAVRNVFNGARVAPDVRLVRHRLPVGYRKLSEVDCSKMPWKRAHRYLLGRGFTDRDIRKFELGYVTRGRYSRYIIFPLRLDGEIVYWTSRYAGDHPRGIKSQNPPKRLGYYSRDHVLLNFDRVRGKRFAMLVEGPLDTVAAINGLGALGNRLSPFQLRLVDRLVEEGLEELCLALDPDAGAEIDEAHAALSERVPKLTTLLLEFGDPASRRAELRALCEGRVEGALSLAQRVRSRLSAK